MATARDCKCLQSPVWKRFSGANYLHPTCVYRKELWLDVGGYDKALPAWEDWEFWIHALSRGWRFHRLDQPTYDYRVRPGSLVTKTQDRAVVETIVQHIVTKHRELYRRYLPERLGPIWLWPEMLEQRIKELENSRT